MTKNKCIINTAKLFYQIFSVDYDEEFLNKLLSGGGGNSTLGATLYHCFGEFVAYKISGKALKVLQEQNFQCEVNSNRVTISYKERNNRNKLFSNNAKGAENRRKKGKLLHFDHNPSNKKLLALLFAKVQELKNEKIEYDEKINKLAKYIKTVQIVDLITIEQDDIRTGSDRGDPLTAEERDKLIKDTWYSLSFMEG